MADKPRFEIYHGADAQDYGEAGILKMSDQTPLVMEALGEFGDGGGAHGQQVKMVYANHGVSLSHVWFKSGYPLPLHSHSGDCLYYILAGTVRMGTETLGAGDGFFVGADVPYTYTPGPEGAEVLEFRNVDTIDIRFLAKTRAAWDKTIAKLKAREEAWKDETPPSKKHSEPA